MQSTHCLKQCEEKPTDESGTLHEHTNPKPRIMSYECTGLCTDRQQPGRADGTTVSREGSRGPRLRGGLPAPGELR